MSFPQINTKATNITITPQLETLLHQKLEALGKFIDDTAAHCAVELEKMTDHQSGKIYRAEVNLTVHGTLYRTEATEEQIEQAIDEVRDELKRELQKASGKRQSLMKRGGQTLKNMLRFGK